MTRTDRSASARRRGSPRLGSPRLGSLRLMLPYLRPYAGRVAGASLSLLLAAALVLALGQGVRRLIDHGFVGGSMAQLDRAAAAVVVVVAGLAAATYARYSLVSWLGERIAADLRRDVFARVLALPPATLESTRTGDLLTRLTADVSVLQTLVGSAISQWLRSALLAGGALAMLLVTSPKLAAIVLLVVPAVVLPLVLFGRRERHLSRLAQDRVADLGAYAEETFNALRTVQAFTHEPVDRALFADRLERSVAAAVTRIRNRALLITSVILLGFGAIVFSLWIGGRDVISGRLSGGDLSAFVFYAVLLASSGAQMSELWGEMQRAAGAADRLRDLLENETTPHDPVTPAPSRPPAWPIGRPMGRVRFEAVSFRYPSRPDHDALADFTLDVAAGETVALVGPSGAGKTTLLQLLLRFHDPASGTIRLDGIPLGDLPAAALRRHVGIVPQDSVIFSATAADNIRYGRPDAPDAAVRAAAHAAHADFLADLPQGYGTHLGEKGVRLSGGQRQRVAIARAILRDPAVLLLDEATSALDAESERAVQDALEAVSRNRTTIVVAHRLATVRRADRIVVMDGGRIVATGTHDALIAGSGLYARLARLQFLHEDQPG